MDFWARLGRPRICKLPRRVMVLEAATVILLKIRRARSEDRQKIPVYNVSKQASMCADHHQPWWCSNIGRDDVLARERLYRVVMVLLHIEVSQRASSATIDHHRLQSRG
jgi:hypothetical protein